MPNDDAPTISAATAFGEAGVSGLKHNGGMVTEEFLPELKGRRGVDIYRQMGDNDPVVGGVLYGIEMVLRAVGWSVQPGGESPDAMAQAEFVEQCMDDMSLTWGDFVRVPSPGDSAPLGDRRRRRHPWDVAEHEHAGAGVHPDRESDAVPHHGPQEQP